MTHTPSETASASKRANNASRVVWFDKGGLQRKARLIKYPPGLVVPRWQIEKESLAGAGQWAKLESSYRDKRV